MRVWNDHWRLSAPKGREHRLFVDTGPNVGYLSGIEAREAGTNDAGTLVRKSPIDGKMFERIKVVLGPGVPV